MIAFEQILEDHGGDPALLLRFDADTPELLPYATLTAARKGGNQDLLALAGVYEWQERPLLFLIDGDHLDGNPQRLNRIRRLVAMRGDAPYLAVVRRGGMTIYQVGLDGDAAQSQVPLESADHDRRIVIPHLGNLRPQSTANRRWISDVILKLLTRALDELSGLGVGFGDAISLVGRALFVRFLADREILPGAVAALSGKGAAGLFDDVPAAVATSEWLDETFNGDFLPLDSQTIRALPLHALQVLGHILRRATDGQLQLAWQESGRCSISHTFPSVC